jgi:alkanesulfonate monooxygenase SsuD/methylene tetrahydromethanopterin reductase-like flavin-dependent oxidoreductase (luciferase family)
MVQQIFQEPQMSPVKAWFGYHMPNFTFPGVPAERLFDRVVELACAAEGAGFAQVTVMDHLYQIGGVGPETEPMLEAYTALGALAARTSKVRLGTHCLLYTLTLPTNSRV